MSLDCEMMPDSSDGALRTNEEIDRIAGDLGCKAEIADDSTLFIDIDSGQAFDTFLNNLPLARKLFGITEDPVITESKSGGQKRHIRLYLPMILDPMGRIALQACLGSDLKREMMSLKRVLRGEDNAIVFFERKKKKGAR